jgi:hypothetical protein
MFLANSSFDLLTHICIHSHWPLQGLHLMNLSHVTIFVTHLMSTGAVHVTNCHMVTLILSETQQLRLHDSTDLTCHVPNPATIGAILEGCTRIVFIIPPSSVQPSIAPIHGSAQDWDSAGTRQEKQKQPPPTPPLLDAKDFNWLRTGIPSPNFSVIVQEPPQVPIHGRGGDDDDNEKPDDDSTTGTPSKTNPIASMTTAPNSSTKSSPTMDQRTNGSSSTIIETLDHPMAPSGTISPDLAEEAPMFVHMDGDGDDDDDDDEL